MTFFKKNNPGCLCCAPTATAWAIYRDTFVYFMSPAATPPPEYEETDFELVEDLAGGDAGDVVVGIDLERSRWLFQRADYSVWSMKFDRTDPQELWTTSSDAAGYKLNWVKYHHKWGFAGAMGETIADDTETWLMALDANGDVIHGPYDNSVWSTHWPGSFHVDHEGHLYAAVVTTGSNADWTKVTDDGTAFGTHVGYRYYIYRDDQIGVNAPTLEDPTGLDPADYWAKVERNSPSTPVGTYHWLNQLYHDGEKLYFRLKTEASTDEDAIYSTTGGTSITHVLDIEDVRGSAKFGDWAESLNVAVWDDTHGLVYHGFWIFAHDLSTNLNLLSEYPWISIALV